MDRTIETRLYSILDLILSLSRAPYLDYHDDAIHVIAGLFEMVGNVSKEDIEAFAREKYLTDERKAAGWKYWEGAYHDAIERLEDVKSRWGDE